MSETRPFACNLCEAMCGLLVTVEDGRVVEVRGDRDDPFSRGHLCPKGAALGELHADPDRLRAPVRRLGDRFVPIGWDEALAEAAARLRAVRAAHGRDAIAYYVGNPTVHSHRAALGAQVLQTALGTRNRYDPNSQDSNPRLFACWQVYGDGLAMPVPDVDRTDHLLILGANPAASSGSQMALGDPRGRLRGIRARGGRIVVVDPRRSETAAWADAHHFIRPGGDAALLFALLHVLFAERRIDEAAVRARASGLDELRALAAQFPPERVAAATGMAPETMRAIARDFAAAERAVAHGRVGICQQPFGPLANWLVEALNLVTGNFDRAGGALFPEPAADLGPLARLLVGNRYDRWRSRVRGLPEFLGSLPSAALAEEMETAGPGQVRALVCFAGNPVLSTPNGPRLARAIERLDFVVAIDLYLNETSRRAHLVLPPLTVLETGNFDLFFQALAVRNVVRYSPPVLPRPDGARDDFEILAELALRLRGPNRDGAARLCRRVARGLPERVVDLLLRAGPMRGSLAEVARAARGIDRGPLRPTGSARVRTPDGKPRLAPPLLSADVPRLARYVDADAGAGGGLALIGRRHLRSNNSWMHNLRSLAKGPDRARLIVHPADAARLGVTDGARVRVASRAGAVEAIAKVSDEVMPGVVSLPHGFGHGEAAATLRTAGALPGPSMNALTDERVVEPLTGTSILSGVPVTVEPLARLE